MSKKINLSKKSVLQNYLALKEMSASAWQWGKKDFESCSPRLKHIMNVGLYFTCLVCLWGIWNAYYYRCACELSAS